MRKKKYGGAGQAGKSYSKGPTKGQAKYQVEISYNCYYFVVMKFGINFLNILCSGDTDRYLHLLMKFHIDIVKSWVCPWLSNHAKLMLNLTMSYSNVFRIQLHVDSFEDRFVPVKRTKAVCLMLLRSIITDFA